MEAEDVQKFPKCKLKLTLAIDLLMKRERNKELTNAFIRCLIENKLKGRFGAFKELNDYGAYSAEFITHVVKAIRSREKTKSRAVNDFLDSIRKGKDIFLIVAKAKH